MTKAFIAGSGTTAPARRIESVCASSGVDPAGVEIGDSVTATVESSETTDDRTITFRPTDGTHD